MSRVVSWRPCTVEVAVWSQELEDLEGLMRNKLELGDQDGYRYNAARFARATKKLVDHGLQNLASAEQMKGQRIESVCCILGAIAVACAPVTTIGLMLPAAVTVLVIAGVRWRSRRRVADILSFRCDGAVVRKIRFNFLDTPVGTDTNISTFKGGPND